MTNDQLLELLTLDRTDGKYGTTEYRLNGELHRDNGPAAIHADGSQWWYQHDKLHRKDGPAIICADGTKCWYQRDKLHRDDGPAIINADASEYWYHHGKFIK